MRPLLVGEMSTSKEDPYTALWPPTDGSAKRLCKILDLSAEEYERMFDRVNLCYEEWDWKVARAMAETLLKMSSYQKIILLGRKVIGAFGFESKYYPWFIRMWRRDINKEFLLLPHPSGRCRLWNDAVNIHKARVEFSRFMTRSMLKADLGV